jgi:hypothetical protein
MEEDSFEEGNSRNPTKTGSYREVVVTERFVNTVA